MKSIIGVLLILVGVWLMAMGVANMGNQPSFAVPAASIVIGLIPAAVSDLPIIGSFGALLPLGLTGLCIGLYGLRTMLYKPPELDDEEEVVTQTDGGIPIAELINMSQGTITQEQVNSVINKMRPHLKQYTTNMNQGAIDTMARYIIQYEVLRFQRDAKKNVSADQYSTQSHRMSELEDRAFARRYMPQKMENLPAKAKESIGKVYDLHTQSGLEQEFHSNVKDWMDVSLENLPTVMAQVHSGGST